MPLNKKIDVASDIPTSVRQAWENTIPLGLNKDFLKKIIFDLSLLSLNTIKVNQQEGIYKVSFAYRVLN